MKKYDTLGDVTQKSAGPVISDQGNLLDLPNICFMGTNVVSGHATAVVVCKGAVEEMLGISTHAMEAGIAVPLDERLAIHWLLQNLMYDISQLALPWDKMDKEYLVKPRKWDAKNIGRFMLWIGPTSSIFDITTFTLMWYVFATNSVEMQTLFQSGWFIEGLLSQTLVVHMLRTRKIPFFQSTAAWPVLMMTCVVIVLGIYVPFSPLGTLVGLQPLPLAYFPWLVGTLLSYCCVAQLMKTIYIRRFKQWY